MNWQIDEVPELKELLDCALSSAKIALSRSEYCFGENASSDNKKCLDIDKGNIPKIEEAIEIINSILPYPD